MKTLILAVVVGILIGLSYKVSTKPHEEINLTKFTMQGQPADQFIIDHMYKSFQNGCEDGISTAKFIHHELKMDEYKICKIRVDKLKQEMSRRLK